MNIDILVINFSFSISMQSPLTNPQSSSFASLMNCIWSIRFKYSYIITDKDNGKCKYWIIIFYYKFWVKTHFWGRGQKVMWNTCTPPPPVNWQILEYLFHFAIHNCLWHCRNYVGFFYSMRQKVYSPNYENYKLKLFMPILFISRTRSETVTLLVVLQSQWRCVNYQIIQSCKAIKTNYWLQSRNHYHSTCICHILSTFMVNIMIMIHTF